MALFSFGKKDKNPPETPASVAKAPPSPPKIQNPPAAGVTSSVPSVKPPQPSGLIPSTGMSARAATTQPMVMPRSATGGLKPARPGVAQSTRSTQRIVLPASTPNAKGAGAKPQAMSAPTGRVNLPIGMILRCLPPEVLASDLAEFEASGAAATEIGLPMNMILGQLPSGKVEIALQDLVPHFPPGYLQPTESIASYLPTLINLPLMDVVMRIPPDLLSLRPDQKDVDAAVINMADPFTEEILREQAEAARQAAAKANIIEENQVPPTEEFVPQAQAAAPTAAPKTTVPLPTPPQRQPTAGLPMPPQRQPTSSLPKPAAAAPTPPMPPAHQLPTPSLMRPPAAPTAPNSSSRTISASGRLPAPSRATTPIPTRPLPVPAPMTNQTVPMPPPMRPAAPAPLPPQPAITATPPRPTPPSAVVLPVAPPPPEGFSRRAPTGPVPMPPLPPAIIPQAAPVEISQPEPAPVAEEIPQEEPAEAEAAPEPVAAEAPASAGGDDLARLASLAMQQMGEEEETPAEVPPPSASQAKTIPIPPPPPIEEETAPEPVAVAAPEPEPEPEPEPQPEPEPEPEPIPAPIVTPKAAAPVATPPPAKTKTAPLPPLSAIEPPKTVPQPPPSQPEPTPQAAPSPAVALNLNTCTSEDLNQIPGCTRELAAAIIHYRTKIRAFKKLEDLLEVPGMTKTAYTNLTGELPPSGEVPQTLNELLGFPPEQTITLKDVTDRISCWPDVTGCVLSQSSGLALVGSVPAGFDKSAIVAFVPRMFESINKSFGEITGKETDELIIPTTGTSFNILRNKDLYMIILSRMPLMPERHLKVARFVLAGLSIREN